MQPRKFLILFLDLSKLLPFYRVWSLHAWRFAGENVLYGQDFIKKLKFGFRNFFVTVVNQNTIEL